MMKKLLDTVFLFSVDNSMFLCKNLRTVKLLLFFTKIYLLVGDGGVCGACVNELSVCKD